MADNQQTTVRSRQQIEDDLVNDPKNHNRKDEVELLCKWRRAYEAHQNEGFREFFRRFMKDNEGQPQAIRALNLTMAYNGIDNIVYKDAAVFEKPAGPSPNTGKLMALFLLQAKDKQILLPDLNPIRGPEDLGIRPRKSDVTEQMSFGLGWHEELYDAFTCIPAPAFKH